VSPTLKSLKRRVAELTLPKDKMTGCMEWVGSYHADGQPRIKVSLKDGTSEYRGLARIQWELHGRRLNPGSILRRTCENLKCVNIHHMQEIYALSPIEKRKRACAFSDKDITEMRRLVLVEGMTCQDVAAKFGTNCPYVSRVVRGVSRAAAPFPKAPVGTNR
jgi:hypothetical protein